MIDYTKSFVLSFYASITILQIKAETWSRRKCENTSSFAVLQIHGELNSINYQGAEHKIYKAVSGKHVGICYFLLRK